MENCMRKIAIETVKEQSIAQEMGIEPGDFLLSVNNQQIVDVFDYKYLIQDELLEVLIEKPNGEQWVLEIEKEAQEDLGMTFLTSLMDEVSGCRNKCMFCFIDQLPKGMRKTLYFKDDDSRLSFFQGNYVTMTNMSKEQVERIVYYHMSPINVSVHTTDCALRIQMLRNKNAGALMAYLEEFNKAGIEVNTQIVLVKGVNDGWQLDKTLTDLGALNCVQSISVVPVGLTRYRDGLDELAPIRKEDAAQIIKQIEGFQEQFLAKKGRRIVFASDEIYLRAQASLPKYETYEQFYQLENGVGMLRLFEREFEDALLSAASVKAQGVVHIATGASAYPFMLSLVAKAKLKLPGKKITVHKIENRFFGEMITVSGLLTGADIVAQLKDKNLTGTLLIPGNALREGKDVLLDDMTINEIAAALGVAVMPVAIDGGAFFQALLCAGS